MQKFMVLVLMAGILGACSLKSPLEALVLPAPTPPIDGLAMKFSQWSGLKGTYNLVNFDGKEVRSRNTQIAFDPDGNFYSRELGYKPKTLLFPLFFTVSENSDGTYNFGPMEDLGESHIKSENGVDTFKYHFKGPVVLEGIDIDLDLTIQVVSTGDSHTVEYTIEVPGFIPKDSHKFILKRTGG